MTKTVTQIDCPKEWESVDDWDSHRPLLYLAMVNNLEGRPVCEFGSGMGSTNLLRSYCKENNRTFQSFDTDIEWCDRMNSIYVKDFEDAFPNTFFGILFIDGKPGEDRKDLINLHRFANVIIAHDTEEGANYVYGMKEVLSTFKYRLDYEPIGKPRTTAVSNTVDVTKWVQ